MTVANTSSSVSYNGDGATKAFPTTFMFLGAADLTVKVTTAGVDSTKALNVDYTVDGAAAAEPGGTVNFIAAPANGTVVTITRNTPEVQPVQLQQSGRFPPASVMQEFDRLTLIVQELTRRIAALEAGSAPVTLANALVTDTFVPADPVEGSFPRNVACVGTPKDVLIAKVEDLTDGTTIHYGLGFPDVGSFVANQFTVKFVPGLVPGHNTRITYLVLT